MKPFLKPLLPVMATVCIVAGIHANLTAQEVKQTPGAIPRPNLRLWKYPDMQAQSDREMLTVATLTGKTTQNYAKVFDYYAKKIGTGEYDAKPLTTFQLPNHELISALPSDESASSSCYVNSQTMKATFCKRMEHTCVSIFLSKNKQSNETYIALTATTF